jgi:hypothetical protein
MNTAIIGTTEAICAALFPQQHDRHAQDWRWHMKMVNVNPNYLADIAARQAAKLAAGIGPEGMCRA